MLKKAFGVEMYKAQLLVIWQRQGKLSNVSMDAKEVFGRVHSRIRRSDEYGQMVLLRAANTKFFDFFQSVLHGFVISGRRAP